MRVCLQALAALLAMSALLLRSASGDTLDPGALPTESGGAALASPSPPAIPGSDAAAQGQAAAGPAQASADQASAPALYTYKVRLSLLYPAL